MIGCARREKGMISARVVLLFLAALAFALAAFDIKAPNYLLHSRLIGAGLLLWVLSDLIR
jgi:hypothetical protein